MNFTSVPHITRPRAVARHLQTISYDVTAACMTSSYLELPGMFDAAGEGNGLVFVGRPGPLSRVARIEPGQAVRIDYRFQSEPLFFVSRIMGEEEHGAWRLARPRSVQRRTRRGNERHPVTGENGLRMAIMTNQGIQPFPIVDLSSSGAAVQYDPRRIGLWIGRRLTVWLEAPERTGVAVTIEVRHVSRRGCGPGHKFAGVRFVDASAQARQAIDRVLVGG